MIIRLNQPFFLLGICLYIMVVILRTFNIHLPYINDYLTDFIGVGIITFLCNYISNRFIFFTPNKVYPSWFTLFLVIYLSIVFEGILPKLSPRYTADPFDVIAYTLGGLTYIFLIKSAHKKMNI